MYRKIGIQSLFTAVLMGLAMSAYASIFPYQEVSIGRESITVSGAQGTINAYGLGARFLLKDRYFVTARYANGSGDINGVRTNISGNSLGIGRYMTIGEETDLFGGINVVLGNVGLSADSFTTSATRQEDSVYIGFRRKVYPLTELNGMYHYGTSGNSSSQLGMRYYLGDGVALTAGVATGGDSQSAAIGVVFHY